MGAKEKLIGFILIAAGILPFAIKIQAIGDLFTTNQILSYILPGEIAYQIIIIALGVLLIWRMKPRIERVR